MPFQGFDVPTSFPTLGVQPKPVDSGLGSLAEALASIAQQQRQRKMDESTLRNQELQRRMDEATFAEQERSRTAEVDAAKAVREAFTPEQLGPIGPNDAAQTQEQDEQEGLFRTRKAIDLLRQRGTPEALKVANDLQTKVDFGQQKIDLQGEGLKTRQQQLRNNLLLGFLKNAQGLRAVAPAMLMEAGLDPKAVENLPQESQQIQFYDDPVKGRRPYVMTKQGVPHWLDEFSAQAQLAGIKADVKPPIRVVHTPQGDIYGAYRRGPNAFEPIGLDMGGTPGITPTSAGPMGIPEPDPNAPAPKTLFTDGTQVPTIPVTPEPSKLPMQMGGKPLALAPVKTGAMGSPEQIAIRQFNALKNSGFGKMSQKATQVAATLREGVDPYINPDTGEILSNDPLERQTLAQNADRMLAQAEQILTNAGNLGVTEKVLDAVFAGQTLGEHIAQFQQLMTTSQGAIEKMSPMERRQLLRSAKGILAGIQAGERKTYDLASPELKKMLEMAHMTGGEAPVEPSASGTPQVGDVEWVRGPDGKLRRK